MKSELEFVYLGFNGTSAQIGYIVP